MSMEDLGSYSLLLLLAPVLGLPIRIARASTVLMKRLGYARFVTHWGDWESLGSRHGTTVNSTVDVSAELALPEHPLCQALRFASFAHRELIIPQRQPRRRQL